MACDMPMEDSHPSGFDSGIPYNNGLFEPHSRFAATNGRHDRPVGVGDLRFLNTGFAGGSEASDPHIFSAAVAETSASIVSHAPLSSVGGVAAPLDPVTDSPAMAITIDGLASTFIPTQIMREPIQATTHGMASQSSIAVPTPFSVAGVFRDIPVTLNFATGRIDSAGVSGLSSNRGTLPRSRLRNTRRSRARGPATSGTDALPVQGPLAPPQREGAPLDYKRFGGCDAVCQHCHALFWREERRTGIPASATPQYQRFCSGGRVILPSYGEYPAYIVGLRLLREDVVEGLIQFLNSHNALVHLFRTARDKLREADIPEFQIRLFGVASGNQYELPTADTIGAIVYDGGPEAVADYDVVIQRHSGEAESNETVDLINTKILETLDIDERLYRSYDEAIPKMNDGGATELLKMALTSNVDPQMQISTPILQQRSLAYFTELNPADNTKFIEARVYRKWTTTKVPSLIPTCFSCMLLDKKGSAMQANADLKEKERFERDLQINCVYRIQSFGFEKTDNWGKTLDNDMTLCFGKHTQIDLLKDDDYPYHYFNFAAYNELGGRLERKNSILTDYIGYVHNVEKVKEYGGPTGNKIKLRNIGIRNLNNNVVTFTLWNEQADEFEKMSQLQLSATSATSYYFNPPIQATAELITAYNEGNTAGPQLEIQTERLTNWEQERTRNRVALGTLLQIDPNTQQRVLFTQEVMILRVDDTHEWYYEKCDECGGKLTHGYVHGHCHQYGTQPTPQKTYSFRLVMTDGTANASISCFSPQPEGLIKDVNTLLEEVADKSPDIIPAQILALQNTRHVFQFHYAKPVGKGAPTFILQKVMDNIPSLLPAQAAGPSTPATASTYDQSDINFSPPPATPLATQETPTDIPPVTRVSSSSSVRKELFVAPIEEEVTVPVEEEVSPQAKKQKID
ncbi:hypothetical protein CTI12_AA554730 [Artemisia annua]|uniref:Replication protein A 70 kDa DNA-binding subunit B/D first OB fold domain-containing protein n=1 Tax=Artemisia annua TaxID=35608 RepID=A0A2U1KX75_ARTAN|nr:hypothetical protein CTI12_AA554730 [Artemisia annua]